MKRIAGEGVGAERESEARAPRSSFALATLSLFAILGFSLFVGLGVWQLERRVWKLDLIERVTHRLAARPVAAPGPARWAAVNANDDDYKRVVVTGHFVNDRETLVQAVTDLGPGFWVLTPLETAQGFAVLVNRGFVPAEKREAATRAAGELGGEVTVSGLMRMTEPKGGFLRSNDPAHDRWFSRDVAAIVAARGITNAAPYFIDADATPNPGGLPVGGLTVVAFRNTHLVYALTWFGLALTLAVAAFRFGRAEFLARRAASHNADLAQAIEPVSWQRKTPPGGTVQSTC